MHPNPAYRGVGAARNLAFARERGFGILSMNGAEGPLLAHVPFLISDDGKVVDLHLMRSNPVWRALEVPSPAVIAVSGPDSYISPDWYGIADQVPTWNYIAVHLRGTLERRPVAELRAVLDRLSDAFEERLLPKDIWKTDKMPADLMAKMMRQIMPVRLRVATVDGTWKLAQNKPDAARVRAAGLIAGFGVGQDVRVLAALMQDPPES